MDTGHLWLLLSIAVIAFLYSSVGFGGASGYLAAMGVFLLPPAVMSSTALMLNVIVSSIAFIAYYRERYFAPRLLWPFLATSIPTAFLGGYLDIPRGIYLLLLYASLTYVCFRMLIFRKQEGDAGARNADFPIWVAMLAGAAIGLLSGIVGIGGGIFLSPLIVLASWGTPKQAAASAAAFIFVNSISGLAGRLLGGNLELGLFGLSLIPLGLVGALAGSRIGARYLSNASLRRLLGVILLIAIVRFWLGYFNLISL